MEEPLPSFEKKEYRKLMDSFLSQRGATNLPTWRSNELSIRFYNTCLYYKTAFEADITPLEINLGLEYDSWDQALKHRQRAL